MPLLDSSVSPLFSLSLQNGVSHNSEETGLANSTHNAGSSNPSMTNAASAPTKQLKCRKVPPFQYVTQPHTMRWSDIHPGNIPSTPSKTKRVLGCHVCSTLRTVVKINSRFSGQNSKDYNTFLCKEVVVSKSKHLGLHRE